jgi:CRP/FNR family transcriptional regulator, cyclic AMP receptor protein
MATSATDESEQFLATPLLSGADDGARLVIFHSLVETSAPAGTPLLTQGKPNDKLWFVPGGSIAIERRQPDGRIDVLANLSGPAIFGTTTFFRTSAPSSNIRATSNLRVWTLDHRSYNQLRREHPRAAEALALEVVRVLSEHFDQLDARLAEMMAEHEDDHPRANEWASFRTRLFEETSI